MTKDAAQYLRARLQALTAGLVHVNPRQYAVIAATFVRWVVLGAGAGVLGGAASAVFLFLLDWATATHTANPWLLYLMPLAGVGISAFYARFGSSVERGNNLIIEEVHRNKQDIPLRMAPLILLATVGTHLFGGSAGREGTAVQMGGALADRLARWLNLSREERRLLLMAGISSGFGSVFGTPIAGALFGLEVQSVGRIRLGGLIPCVTAAVVGDYVARLLGAQHALFPRLPDPDLNTLTAAKVVLAGVLFGLCSIAFIESTHGVGRLLTRAALRAWWLRPVVGGVAIIGLTQLVGSNAYSGLSTHFLGTIWAGGAVPGFAFLIKLLFTSITLGAGFKGGEVTPLFVIGATFGYSLAPFLGLDPQLLAALGLVAVFAGASNTPIACMLLGVELFGGGALVYIALACAVSYTFSGHRSIYSAQRLDTPKYLLSISRRAVVRDVMTDVPVTVVRETPLATVLTMLAQRGVRSAVVVDDANTPAPRVVGIVTETDVFRGIQPRPGSRPGSSAVADPAAPQPAEAPAPTVMDVMTRDPVVVGDGASLDEASALMLERNLKRLPVIGRAGQLKGVISRSDILRRMAEDAHLGASSASLTTAEPHLDLHTAAGWLHPDVATAGPEEALDVVFARLVADPCQRVIVIDSRRHVTGIITDAEILAQLRGRSDGADVDAIALQLRGGLGPAVDLPGGLTAGDIAAPAADVVAADTPTMDIIRRMVERRVKYCVVVDAQARLCGVVDRHDMLRAITAGVV